MKPILLTFLLPLARLATAFKLPKNYHTTNKLPSLGPPNLVAPSPEGRHGAAWVYRGGEGHSSPYTPWTTSPCDREHPYTAVQDRPWQEVQVPGINVCFNLGNWFQDGDLRRPHRYYSGYVFRVEHFSMLPSSEDMSCKIEMWNLNECTTKMFNLSQLGFWHPPKGEGKSRGKQVLTMAVRLERFETRNQDLILTFILLDL